MFQWRCVEAFDTTKNFYYHFLRSASNFCVMSDDRKVSDDRRYAILPIESIRAFAEAAGHSDIPDDVASMLAEDVAYRLREATQVELSCHFLLTSFY